MNVFPMSFNIWKKTEPLWAGRRVQIQVTSQLESTISWRRFAIGQKSWQTPASEAWPNWLLRCCDFQWDRLQCCHGGVQGATQLFPRGALGILTALWTEQLSSPFRYRVICATQRLRRRAFLCVCERDLSPVEVLRKQNKKEKVRSEGSQLWPL